MLPISIPLSHALKTKTSRNQCGVYQKMIPLQNGTLFCVCFFALFVLSLTPKVQPALLMFSLISSFAFAFMRKYRNQESAREHVTICAILGIQTKLTLIVLFSFG